MSGVGNTPDPAAERAHLMGGSRIAFWCPGCDEAHAVSSAWEFNGDTAAPTLTPSVLVTGVQWPESSPFYKPRHRAPAGGRTACHSFVTGGRIQFLGDSTHDLAGQTVDIPAWEAVRRG